MARNIVECIAPEGIVEEFNNDSIKNCLPLDKNEIYVNITLGNDSVAFGDDFLKTLCEIEERKTKIKYYPSCLEEKYYVIENNQDKQLSLFLAIKKTEKNL